MSLLPILSSHPIILTLQMEYPDFFTDDVCIALSNVIPDQQELLLRYIDGSESLTQVDIITIAMILDNIAFVSKSPYMLGATTYDPEILSDDLVNQVQRLPFRYPSLFPKFVWEQMHRYAKRNSVSYSKLMLLEVMEINYPTIVEHEMEVMRCISDSYTRSSGSVVNLDAAYAMTFSIRDRNNRNNLKRELGITSFMTA